VPPFPATWAVGVGELDVDALRGTPNPADSSWQQDFWERFFAWPGEQGATFSAPHSRQARRYRQSSFQPGSQADHDVALGLLTQPKTATSAGKDLSSQLCALVLVRGMGRCENLEQRHGNILVQTEVVSNPTCPICRSE